MRWILCTLLAAACGGDQDRPPRAPHGGSHHDKAPIGHRFVNAQDWVPTFEGPERDAWQRPDHVIDLLAIEPGMVIADIGAGTGYFLPRLSRATGAQGRVIALDIEPDMVRHMQERADKEGLGNVEARVVEVDDPGLEPDSIDRILIVDTWHHIPSRTEYSKKLKASLSERGAVYIVDFTMETKRGPPKAHRVRPSDVIAELRAAGMNAALAKESLPDQYVVVAR